MKIMSCVEWSLYTALGIIYLLLVPVTSILGKSLKNEHLLPADPEESKGAIAGRVVQIPGNEYRLAFKAGTPKLGDCALKMGSSIQFCNEAFGGDEVFIPKASTVIDVSRVQSSEDILNHIMGGLGVSVGVLGLASVDVKVNVAVTTQTSATSLNLMSSYEVQRGTLTLQNAHPKTQISRDGTLFLSEIQLGGNEILLVTMDFESESKKTEVEISVKVKILFITISAKMKFIKETFKSASSVRVQFISSWRTKIDKAFGYLDDSVIKEVEEIEKMYMSGPEKLSKMPHTDERMHNSYYFAAWNSGPYGEGTNLATVTSDLESLKQQTVEVNFVIDKIDKLLNQGVITISQQTQLIRLKGTLSPISEKLAKGLDEYHAMSSEKRNALYEIYGTNLAPLHYERKLWAIMNT